MINIFRRSLYRNGYLLIIAAWLYTISFIFSNYLTYSSSAGRVQKQLESLVLQGENKFAEVLKDTTFINEALSGSLQSGRNLSVKKNGEGLFIYTLDSLNNPNLVFWNNNKMLPDGKDLAGADGIHPSTHPNGYFEFIKQTLTLKGRQVMVCSMVPVYWNYGISNKYLQSGFPVEGWEKQYAVTASGADIYIRSGKGKTLFGLEKREDTNDSPGYLPIGLRIAGVIFLLIWLNGLALGIMDRKGWKVGLGFLFCCLAVLRFISYFLPFPFRFRNLSLFDSTIYGSNFLHPTLGDLLINVILVYWLISFVKSAIINSLKTPQPVAGRKGWMLSLLISAMLILISFTAAGIIRSLINDSQISFDVTNFFSLNIFSFLSFIILCFIVLSFFHLSHIILFYLYQAVNVPAYARYIFVAVSAMIYLSLTVHYASTVSNIVVLVWLLIYMCIMELRKEDIFIPILRSSYFIIWIIFFAASISGLIIYQNGIVNEQKRIRAAEKLATEADKNAQYIFSTGIADIDSSFLLANLANLKNKTTNKIIKDSLSNRYLSVTADAYDTRILTFDENDVPLYNDDSTSIFSLRNFVSKGHETIAADLYYFEKESNVFSFIYEKDLRNKNGEIKGYFFVVGDPKRYKSQAIYPELFMPGNGDEADKNVAYAIYNKGHLVESSGDYNFLTYLPVAQYPKALPENKHIAGEVEFRYNAGNGKLVVTVHSQSVFLEFITLFAYLFCAFLFIIILFQAGRLLVQFKFNINKMRRGMNFNIKYQIQAAIVFISISSFFIIGVSTITFYINRFTQTNREKLIKSMKIFSNEIESGQANHQLFSNVDNYDSSMNDLKLQKAFKEVAAIHNIDANFFDLQGNLKATTQPEIYKKQILSSMMNPVAYTNLAHQQEIQVIQDEQVSNFSFLSIYVPVYDQAGKPFAYLNIPYLNTQKELNQEISNFLVTLINLNAFIFLIAGALSVLLTNRITNSFSLIADKMKKINIGTANEEIKWQSNDEIGALVNGYNKMVKKLEDSATALARSEREGAWREMARQVAHEIKNPLTPMKLSIQYLQRAIQQNDPNTLELSQKVSATLVEQIDQLAKIASDFSQFANITKVKMKVFDLNELIKSLIDLYSSNERLSLTYNDPQAPLNIKADRSQVYRLFTNLFQNAIEASEDKATVIINIFQRIGEGKLHIGFSDKGSGISLEKRDKIFTPNFTTKSSGTGLGLAISKGIVENASGRIWFDTEDGKGTTFHILLPLAGHVNG